MTRQRRVILVGVALWMAGCAANKPVPPPPANAPLKYPSYPAPEIPATLKVTQDLRARHDLAWRRLQFGDLRTAQREFTELVRRNPTFYPAETGLGYVFLADREFRAAATRFANAIDRNGRYLPAWYGQAEAQLGLGNDAEAVTALERVIALDPKREQARTRLDLLRFKQLQAMLETAQRARDAGRTDQARATLEKALALAPNSALVLRQLGEVETTASDFDAADAHIRKAIQIDPTDPESHAALALLLQRRERYRDAAAAYAKAASLEPRPEWTAAAEEMREKAVEASVPAEFRSLSSAATVTRAQLAAYIGLRLERLLASAPKRVTGVATDIRNHWAAEWIVAVTQADVMDIFPNHTFQPNANVRRSDLAHIVGDLLRLALPAKSPQLIKWRAARPRFVDLPQTHLSYAAAALAVSSGAMTVQADNRFAPTRPATGRDVTAAIARIEQLAPR